MSITLTVGKQVSEAAGENAILCLVFNMLWLSSEQYLYPTPSIFMGVIVQSHQVISQYVGAVIFFLAHVE